MPARPAISCAGRTSPSIGRRTAAAIPSAASRPSSRASATPAARSRPPSAGRWSGANWSSPTSRRWTWRAGAWSASRLCCGGTDPKLGRLLPAQFIAMAEEMHIIGGLDLYGLRRACMEAAALPGMSISVNIAPSTMRSADFAQQIGAILKETGFDPARLEIEVPETIVLNSSAELRPHVRGAAGAGGSASRSTITAPAMPPCTTSAASPRHPASRSTAPSC